VRGIADETPTAKTFMFQMAGPTHHLPGQYYEIRLTAEDGYQAARPYSAASPARDDMLVDMTITLMADGEVSPYMFDQLRAGDKLELRGPLGKFFVWEPSITEPVLLIAGGSGIVPLRCIRMAHQKSGSKTPIQLLYSTTCLEEIIYKDELTHMDNVTITLTGRHPDDWRGETGRINDVLMAKVLAKLPDNPLCYVCGMTSFVEAITGLMLDMGIPPARIKAERFGA